MTTTTLPPPATPGPPPDRAGPLPVDRRARLGRAAPALLALASFGLLVVVALVLPYRLREPDPYAYRAAIAALESGDVTLDAAAYHALAAQLAADGDGWDATTAAGGAGPGGAAGIRQWTQLPDGTWVSEKNPGYAFLAVPFDALGLIRLAPLAYGALGCLGLWLGVRRWSGRWAAAFTIGAFCSAAGVLIMAHRAYMPTFTEAALLAAGAGLLLWAVAAVDRSPTRRTVVGALGALALGIATATRYTDLLPSAVIGGWAFVAARRARWQLGWRTATAWVVAGAVPLALVAVYDQVVFGRLWVTGYDYAGGSPTFDLASLEENLGLMPVRLVAMMPVALVAAAAVVGMAVVAAGGGRLVAASSPPDGGAGDPDPGVEPTVAARWLLPLTVGWWVAVWGLYLAYAWTTRNLEGHPIITTRFYVPAMGGIAVLAGWGLARLPRVVGIVVLSGLLVLGGWATVGALSSGPMFTDTAVGPGGAGGAGPGGPPTGLGPGARAVPGPPGGQRPAGPPPGGASGGGAVPGSDGGAPSAGSTGTGDSTGGAVTAAMMP